MKRINNNYQSFNSCVKKISQVFCNYSIEDVATSLFISNIWLPNIASPIKHQLLTAIFVSLKPEQFKKTNVISTYDVFKRFLGEIYPLLPSFPLLEDYVPETDWGNVKFHHEGSDYMIFYGSELENVYDYLMLFQMLYASLDEYYYRHSMRSPSMELQQCLTLQDEIISKITSQPNNDQLTGLMPGHIETPSEHFWEEVRDFYSNYHPEQSITKSFLEQYSAELGSLPSEFLEQNAFGEGVFSGRLLSALFVKHGDQFFPILPRRYSSILLDSWSKIFADYHEEIDKEKSYFIHLNSEIYAFLEKRISSKSLFPFVSAVTEQGAPHEILFSASFISKDKLILIYAPSPFHSAKQMGEELSKAAPKLVDAVRLISASPVTLGLRSRGTIVKYDTDSKKKVLKPLVFIVLSQTSTSIQSIPIPETLRPCKIMFLDQFLGIMDEIDNVDEISSFVEYLEEINGKIQFPLTGMLDKYASFKDSSGLLVGGARQPTHIMLAPGWGSSMRYKSLSEFWRLYPSCGFFDHPRSWRLERESPTRIRLSARGYFGGALYCRLGSSHFFTNSPFHKMSFEQGQIANLLMESLEDSISRNKMILEKLECFRMYSQFLVSFFPHSLVSTDDDLKHLRHLDPKGSLWCADIGFVRPSFPGIRIVFDEKALTNALQEVKDGTIEINLITEVLSNLNKFTPDSELSAILNHLAKQKSNKPRFKLFLVQKEVSFPDFVPDYGPSVYHYKRAGKRVAELALQTGFSPGSYRLQQGKSKLNALRKQLVNEIDAEVTKYNYRSALPYLIERIDALNHKYEQQNLSLKYSLEHEVEYSREKALAREHSEYISQHKNFRYLIEKFVQLQPKGHMSLDKDSFQYLIALIDRLHALYATSDSIHYEIFPVRIDVDNDYIINVKYETDLEVMQKVYGQEEAEIQLGLIGNKDDRVYPQRPIEEYLEELDSAFKQDLGFGIRSMINVLQVLSQWSGFRPEIKESGCYSADSEEIRETCLQNIEGIDSSEIDPILEFLTLKSEEVIRITDQDTPCDDLPVWEYRKRHSRYNLRPLILIDDKYYWGPYSARKSGIIWSNVPLAESLPADIQAPAIEGVLEREKEGIEKALTDKALEIVRRFTQQVEPKVRLHDRDKKGNHPRELGDYDVLAFYPAKNVVLNIETKDILPAFCLKDAKRIREKIFGRRSKNGGYLEKIEKRETHLSNHLIEIAKLLGWSVDFKKLPRVVSVYVSRHSYWWTKFPPRSTDVKFIRVDLLDKFLNDL